MTYTRPIPDKFAHLLKPVFIAIAAFVAYESLTPTGVVESVSQMDKIVHGLAYFSLAFLMAAAWKRSALFFIFMVTLVFGAALEIGQGAMGLGRTASLADQAANMLGAGVAVILWAALVHVIGKFKRST